MVARHPQPLSPQMEDYLEAILGLEQAGVLPRCSRIAKALGVSPASVTSAVKALAARGAVEYDPYGPVRLTPEGRRLAEAVAARHEALGVFLEQILGIAKDRAQALACRLEHALEGDAAARLRVLNRFLLARPRLIGELRAAMNERTLPDEP